MSQIFEILFNQYRSYTLLHIWLEIIAVFFGILSVYFARLNRIWVYPTGLISTSIFVYLLFKWSLLGDLLINAYYFVMSIYGWYIWTRKVDDTNVTPISSTTKKEQWIQLGIGMLTIVFTYSVYQIFDKWNDWTAYVDTLTTAIFFVGMWLMAKRKIENWIYWIIGDLISIPLYFYKGFTFTSLQYLIFTVIAIFGYISWKKNLNNTLVTA
ncbi:nicotinamide riboside transporter PnuC [Aquimarina intermedia]|uniref:Nicotinamide riboside transporter PnuC n=1 Tax=Aquimarina intermedia TaxID=350814 RepID=A0A5S5CF39_9FLAO|nr:nicotinamide riboside transporter PnuC [Aquimarina intermedia]TYP77122.1 nicotinamide mononucleotide transporter [Aquimarina intermedia]